MQYNRENKYMKEMNNIKKAKKVSIAIIIIEIILFAVFVYKRSPYLIDSDSSSEMILGSLLANENRLISQNWFYSTEIRVLNTNIFYLISFKLTNNWLLARTITTTLLLIVLVLSFVFYAKMFAGEETAYKLLPIVLLPISISYYAFVLFGLYYIPHIAISFLCSGLIIKYATEQKGITLTLIMLLVISLLAGLGGIRQLFIFYAPFTCACVIGWIVNRIRKVKEKDKRLFASVLSTFVSCVGYLINKFYLVKKYGSWLPGGGINLKFSLHNVKLVFQQLLTSYGYRQEIISKVLGITLFVFLVISIICGLIKHFAANDNCFIHTLYITIALGMYTCLYAFTTMEIETRYILPISIFSIVQVGIFFKESSFKFNKIAKILIIISCIYNSFSIMSVFAENDYNFDVHETNNEERLEIADYLIKNNYLEGFATYWNANVMTELSNGQLEVWVSSDIYDCPNKYHNIARINNFTQRKDHFNRKPEQKMFFLLTANEYYDKGIFNGQIDENKIIYKSNNFIVFGYNSYEQLLCELSYYNKAYTNEENILHDGNTIYGPYITLYKGKYEVIVEGENLDLANYYVSYDNGNSGIEMLSINKGNNKVKYCIKPLWSIVNVELKIENNSGNAIAVDRIELKKID